MPPTFQQVRDRWPKEDANRGNGHETVYASQIPAALVTNVPEWDSFLRHCQAKLEEANAAANGWKDKLSTAFKAEEQLQAQCSYFSCQARAMTIQELMELPKTLTQPMTNEKEKTATE